MGRRDGGGWIDRLEGGLNGLGFWDGRVRVEIG